jgi:hypothetical protein
MSTGDLTTLQERMWGLKEKSPYRRFHQSVGGCVCIRGYLWELTYSEMGPPDSRQNTGVPCPSCNCSRCGGSGWLDTLDVANNDPCASRRVCPDCRR